MATRVVGFEEAKKLFNSNIVVAATNATLNRSLITVRKEAVKQIRGTYVVTARNVKAAMNMQKSRFSKLQAELNSSDVRLPLGMFKPTQKKNGVSVKIKRGQPRQILKRMFVATMKSGYTGVFSNHRYTRRDVKRRKTHPRRGPRPRHSELPIDEAFTIGTPQMWDLNRSRQVANERMPTVFNQEINYRLNKLKLKTN